MRSALASGTRTVCDVWFSAGSQCFEHRLYPSAEGVTVLFVDVTDQGTDAGQMAPMVEQIEERTGVRPPDVLTDGGFSTKDDIQQLNDPERGYKVYTPVKEEEKQRQKGQDPFAPRPGWP